MFVYEYLIEKMRTQSLQKTHHYKEKKVEAWRTAVAGACAGMISWLPGIPFDVIKTKMMTENDPKRFKSVYHCYSVITKVRISCELYSGKNHGKSFRLTGIGSPARSHLRLSSQ